MRDRDHPVEAAALGRRAVGVELEPRWAELAWANLSYALAPEQAGLAEVHLGDARQLAELLADVAGRVDLVVTSPPYACDAGVIDKPAWRAGGPLCPRDSLNYSRDPANLGRARGPGWQQAMAEVLAGCALLLRPGGLLVTVTKNTRRAGRLNDLATATVQLAEQAGLGYLQHVIALHAAVRQGGLVARPSFWQLTQTRKARARGGAEASAVVGKGVGTPALVLHRDPPVGLLGPLVSPPPAGAEAVRLWAAVVAFTTVPGVLELSRPRPQLTAVPGLRW